MSGVEAAEVWELVKGKFCATASPCSHQSLSLKGSESLKVEAVHTGRVPKSEKTELKGCREGLPPDRPLLRRGILSRAWLRPARGRGGGLGLQYALLYAEPQGGVRVPGKQ